MRPGYLGKYLTFQIMDLTQVEDPITMMKQRWIKPSLPVVIPVYDDENLDDPEFIEEQRRIELDMLNQQKIRELQLEDEEAAEVAQAASEANIKEY